MTRFLGDRPRARKALTQVGAVAATLFAMTAPPAFAVPQPEADPAALPRDSAPSATAGMQSAACSTTVLLPGKETIGKPSPEIEAAWRFSRGEGQSVAIIDTGVQPSPRLHAEPGGDYVQSTGGLTDCDGHGTMVAGLIGGQPGPDGFSGVAPASTLISIRQESEKFSPRITGGDPATNDASHFVSTLARAIVHAANLGARVINISAQVCVPAAKPIDQAALGAALRYAANEKDAVVVTAAGNTSGGGANCQQNPLSGTDDADPRNWSGVESISVPAWWHQYVLSVGSVALDGSPSKFTMAGPWVGIAASGENVTSLSNAPEGGLANGMIGQDGKAHPISGTSFAAAYVSGVAALVRSRFPELTASQVISRLQRTARDAGRSPSNLVGAGTVDPVAALTWEVPTDGNGPTGPSARAIVPPAPPAPENPLPRQLAFLGAGVCLLAVIVVAAFSARRRQETT
ncbi:type VII secretion-associated serine protease mycosin [Mycobacterium sp. CBMA271]|uniref:type VII secretion-associated serine protease mycosin n=1 Tax=unclassified Mycobacteroides TaxID=2618759 RepID=UPI0012DC0B26|nr:MULTISPECIES: type VII secretion-associated serine protease mycosin [unclassified Mycobacteroides]MUM18814.1 type VII secretion-associated serine protease mycosin [Mycobacteroides sp. CBMA 326]MUM22777.1 type VII secretion-associated serine protease mycosin [Mycobacteroides sp. CBMA 271]